MMSRADFAAQFNAVNEFYGSDEGLRRPGGMVLNGVCDIQAMIQWGYDLASGERPLDQVLSAIRQSDEYRRKHQPPQPSYLASAFCIPDGAPGLPYGDRRRIWTPACACYDPPEQRRMIEALQIRGYNALEYQVSGWPYRRDYPEIAIDVASTVRDLTLIKENHLRTVVAFRDDRGPDLSYLRSVAAATQDLVDYCMGIYEVDGVFRDPAIVLSVLRQSRTLYPRAKLALHLTARDRGHESYGVDGAPFWWACAAPDIGLDCYFFQTSGWIDQRYSIARLQDYTRRLMAGFHGYPILPGGVIDFENTTTKTYSSTMSEAQGVSFTDALMNAPLDPDEGVRAVRPAGFMDAGTPA